MLRPQSVAVGAAFGVPGVVAGGDAALKKAGGGA